MIRHQQIVQNPEQFVKRGRSFHGINVTKGARNLPTITLLVNLINWSLYFFRRVGEGGGQVQMLLFDIPKITNAPVNYPLVNFRIKESDPWHFRNLRHRKRISDCKLCSWGNMSKLNLKNIYWLLLFLMNLSDF